MHFLGVAVLLIAGLLWIFGGTAITRPRVQRERSQSLISWLRPSPISLKNLTSTQKRRIIGLIVTTAALIFLGLGMTEGAFD